MKRVLLIFFVLVAAVGACFAVTSPVDGGTILLKTTIGQEPPTFVMHGSYTAVSDTKHEEDAPGTINVGSPADEEIVLSVTLKQSGEFARCNASFKLTVEATAFTHKTTGMEDQTTGVPASGARTLLTGAKNITVSDYEPTLFTNTVLIKVTYAGPKVKTEGLGDIASWVFKWPKKESLASGDYEATVKLTYEIV